MKLKIKLRVCGVCGVKKRVSEFPGGKICNTCSPDATLHESDEDPDDLQSLHTKVDQLTHRLSRMEELMSGLMDLVGKINYDMEIGKAID
jgi:hypothetical protein